MQTRGVNRGVRETPREDSEETEGTAGRLLEIEILHTVGSDRLCHTVAFIRFEARHDDSSDGMLSKERKQSCIVLRIEYSQSHWWGAA
jgi:hypothetical protein